ncbi:VWA domain-containing protein [Nonomuraea phyllanthi]|uniref:vWA domain-containing protein n=1 Tax=Nonomuraea phyllanthi TaxID=2219224 RepID=UPI0012931549|nr:vWA domain-containing protein [Nonomuraea phyllanthi]QFY09569.1 VWA domain-containing protein [Nonomuraea phyllanthi]
MSNPDRRHITIILDRSGSMGSVKADTEGGLKAFLAEQAANPGETFVSLYQFDDEYEPVYEFTALADVPDYRLQPRGYTALLDAVGKTLTTMRDQFDAMPEADVPGNITVVILTDGQENASKEWRSRSKIRHLIEDLQRQGWTFIFLGADQDAFTAAGDIGIGADTTLSYSSRRTTETMTRAGRLVSRGGGGFTQDDRDATRY